MVLAASDDRYVVMWCDCATNHSTVCHADMFDQTLVWKELSYGQMSEKEKVLIVSEVGQHVVCWCVDTEISYMPHRTMNHAG